MIHARKEKIMANTNIIGVGNPNSTGQKFRSPGGFSVSGSVGLMGKWLSSPIVADTVSPPLMIILEKK